MELSLNSCRWGGSRSRWTTVSVDDGLGGRTAMAHVCRLPRWTMSGRASRTADRATAKGDEVAFYRDRCWGRGRSLRIALRGALESRGVYGVCGFCGFYFPFRQMQYIYLLFVTPSTSTTQISYTPETRTTGTEFSQSRHGHQRPRPAQLTHRPISSHSTLQNPALILAHRNLHKPAGHPNRPTRLP